MKKVKLILSLILIVIIMASVGLLSFSVYDVQPFGEGVLSTEKFRIPSAYTLSNGKSLFLADLRNTSGADSPENIDTALAIFDSNNFEYKVINQFEDYALGQSGKDSASYIDSAIVQSKETGRVFVITTSYPSGYGINTNKKGSGMKDGHLILFDKNGNNFNTEDFVDGFAAVSGTDYQIDADLNLYKNHQPLYTFQNETKKKIAQNLFYSSSELQVYPTSYLILKYSDDNGESWSHPVILNYVKNEDEAFMGTCPGRGAVTMIDGKERILFCVYNHNSTKEHVSVIYSDDNGQSWQRSANLKNTVISGKSSESQIINCPDGSLRIFSRNKSRFITSARSTDGGVTWTKLKADLGLYSTKNCMTSFINTSKTIDGKQVVLASFPSQGGRREDGVIATGLMEYNGTIKWIKRYHINEGFFAYSCLTELPDGNIACLYEDGPSHITLGIFNIDNDGNISSINGDDIEFKETNTFAKFFFTFFTRIFNII